MAEETQGAQAAPEEAPQRGAEAADVAGTTDWKAEYDRVLAASRKWERRAKDNAEKARAYDELEAKSATEAERADAATRRAEEAEARVAEYERRAEREAIVAEVARDAGVDAELLSHMAGDTREEVEASARLLSERVGAMRLYPSVSDKGQQRAPRMKEKDISAIKDPAERGHGAVHLRGDRHARCHRRGRGRGGAAQPARDCRRVPHDAGGRRRGAGLLRCARRHECRAQEAGDGQSEPAGDVCSLGRVHPA